jgi:hypothetical protein
MSVNMKILFFTFSFFAALFVFCVGMGWAHDAPPTPKYPLGWTYPWACCSNMDCQPVDGGKDITEVPEGYKIVSTGEVVPYGDKRIKDSPDGEFHHCAHRAGIDAGHTICLFVPPKGF